MDISLNELRRRLIVSVLARPMALPRVFAQAAAPRPLRVVASFSILADEAREVGGSAVEVVALVGPDSDVHVFEPSPLDARRLADADLVVVNGLGFEGWRDRLVRATGYRGPVAVASDGVPVRRLGREPDPHAWQDLTHAQRYARNIRDALARARPALAGEFDQRCAQHVQRLDALDREVRARFDAIPRPQRRLITSHATLALLTASNSCRRRA